MVREECLHEMALGPWVLIYSLILLEKIAGGRNLQTVFLCWRHNKHQKQVFSQPEIQSKSVWCVLVKNRKCLLFGQKSSGLHNIIYYLWPNS